MFEWTAYKSHTTTPTATHIVFRIVNRVRYCHGHHNRDLCDEHTFSRRRLEILNLCSLDGPGTAWCAMTRCQRRNLGPTLGINRNTCTTFFVSLSAAGILCVCCLSGLWFHQFWFCHSFTKRNKCVPSKVAISVACTFFDGFCLDSAHSARDRHIMPFCTNVFSTFSTYCNKLMASLTILWSICHNCLHSMYLIYCL